MRKRFFMIVLAFLLAIPGTILLTACGSSEEKKEIAHLYIDYNEQNIQSVSASDYANYGACLRDFYDKATLYIEYKNGEKKKLVAENFTDEEIEDLQKQYDEKFYYDSKVGEGEAIWTEYGENVNMTSILDAGSYKIEFSIGKNKATLYITISKSYDYDKTVDIVIVNNETTNYNRFQTSTYSYGMPANNQGYYEETYTSDVKAYTYDRDTQQAANDTVIEIQAMPTTLVLPEENETGYDEFEIIYEERNWQVADGADLRTAYLEMVNTLREESVEEYKITNAKNVFLNRYGTRITTGQRYSEDCLIVNTESLAPGEYYTFAEFVDKNHEMGYTTPNSRLTVTKGQFDLKKALRYKTSEFWSEQEAEEIIGNLTLAVNYGFSTYNPKFTENGVKALTAHELNSYLQTNIYEDFDNVDFTVRGGGFSGFGNGEFKLVEKTKYNQDIRFDCSDNGGTAKAVYVLSEYDKKYYEEDPTEYDVDLNITKAKVYRPYAYQGSLEKEYTGSAINIIGENGIIVNDPEVVSITGASWTAIGEHTTRITLKDDVNYEYYDIDEQSSYNYGDENGDFTWTINKITLSLEQFTVTATYGDETQTYWTNFVYNGNRTIRVSLADNPKYEFIKELYPNDISMTWSVKEDSWAVEGASITQDGDDALVSFTGFSSNSGYINLACTISGTNISNELVIENNIQIQMSKADFTDEQRLAILDAIGAEEYEDEYENTRYRLKAESKIIISRVDMNLPNDVLPDYSDEDNLPATAEFGKWKLYYYKNNEYVEKHNGENLTEESTIGWLFRFVPEDNMFNGFEVYVDSVEDMDFVNEDLPTDVVNALKTEVDFYSTSNGYQATGTYATINVPVDGDCARFPQEMLPTHNDEIGIAGTWALRCDAHYSDGSPAISEFGNNSLWYYGEDHSGWYTKDMTKEEFIEYLNSSDRNWRIVFKPTNNAYNDIEIYTTVTFA